MRIRAIILEYEFDDADSIDVSISMKLVKSRHFESKLYKVCPSIGSN